jgi:hypothetical protein
MKLATKLYGSVGATAAIGVLAAGAGIVYLRVINEELRVATESTAVKLDLVNATRARVWEAIASLQSMGLDGGLGNLGRIDAIEKRQRSVTSRVREQIGTIRPLLVSGESNSGLNKLERDLNDFERVSVDYARICRENQPDRLLELAPHVQAFASSADEVLTDLKEKERALLKATQKRSAALSSESFLIGVLLSLLLLVITGLAFVVVRRINGTLAAAIHELPELPDKCHRPVNRWLRGPLNRRLRWKRPPRIPKKLAQWPAGTANIRKVRLSW